MGALVGAPPALPVRASRSVTVVATVRLICICRLSRNSSTTCAPRTRQASLAALAPAPQRTGTAQLPPACPAVPPVRSAVRSAHVVLVLLDGQQAFAEMHVDTPVADLLARASQASGVPTTALTRGEFG